MWLVRLSTDPADPVDGKVEMGMMQQPMVEPLAQTTQMPMMPMQHPPMPMPPQPMHQMTPEGQFGTA